jgi:hypothetical protein
VNRGGDPAKIAPGLLKLTVPFEAEPPSYVVAGDGLGFPESMCPSTSVTKSFLPGELLLRGLHGKDITAALSDRRIKAMVSLFDIALGPARCHAAVNPTDLRPR